MPHVCNVMEILHQVMSMIGHRADARLLWLRNVEETLSIINRKVDKQQRSESQSLALTLYVEGREGFFYTNVFDEASLRRFVERSLAMTRLLAPDESRTLVSPERCYRGGGVPLLNCDDSLEEVPTSQKQSMALATQDEVMDRHPRIISVDSRYVDRIHQVHLLTTGGREVSERSSRCTLSTLVSVRGEGEARPMDGWGQTRIFLRDLPTAGIGSVALERALRKVGQRPLPAGRYTMVVESPVAPTLLQPLLSAMSGYALQQHSSFLEGRLGQRVGSDLLDLLDDPHQVGTRGATYFDYDGAATHPLRLFDHGRLCTYFIDTPMGHKLGMAPTTQGTHRLIMTPSALSLQELLCEQGECILVTAFNGGNCNPVTGHFSYGIEGFLVRDGLYVQPVCGMNITGHILELWQSLVRVAGDHDPYETELIPSLAFEDVSFC